MASKLSAQACGPLVLYVSIVQDTRGNALGIYCNIEAARAHVEQLVSATPEQPQAHSILTMPVVAGARKGHPKHVYGVFDLADDGFYPLYFSCDEAEATSQANKHLANQIQEGDDTSLRVVACLVRSQAIDARVPLPRPRQ